MRLSISRSMLVFFATFLMALYAPLISCLGSGLRAPFSYFAADAFYYMSIARRSSIPFFTFDGTHITNGFHPLWGYILTALLSLPGMHDPSNMQILLVFGLSMLLAATGAGLMAVTLHRLTGSPFVSILGTIPGVYYFLFGWVQPNYGIVWSFINGTESPLSLLFWGLFMLVLPVRGSLGRLSLGRVFVIACLLTAITLSRLDDIFIFLPFFMTLAFSAPSAKWAVRRIIWASTAPVLLIGLYLLSNLCLAGQVLPVNGQAKSGVFLLTNLSAVASTLFPRNLPWHGWAEWDTVAWRALQMAVPLLFSAVWLAVRAVRWVGRRGAQPVELTGETLLTFLNSYVLCKGLFNLSSIYIGHQGHWYYPVSLMIFNLSVATSVCRRFRKEAESGVEGVWAGRLRNAFMWGLAMVAVSLVVAAFVLLAAKSAAPVVFGRYSAGRLLLAVLLLLGGGGMLMTLRVRRNAVPAGSDLRYLLAVGLAVGILLLAGNAFAAMKARSCYNMHFASVWFSRHEIEANLRRVYPSGGIIEFDDGILGYSLGIPALSGLGFAADRELLQAKNEGHLLDLAYRRGNRVFASVNYVHALNRLTSDEEIHALLQTSFWFHGQDLTPWAFRVVYRHANPPMTFVEFYPRPISAGG